MRRYLVITCILSYAVLGMYDPITRQYRTGAVECLLAVVNAILFL